MEAQRIASGFREDGWSPEDRRRVAKADGDRKCAICGCRLRLSNQDIFCSCIECQAGKRALREAVFPLELLAVTVMEWRPYEHGYVFTGTIRTRQTKKAIVFARKMLRRM